MKTTEKFKETYQRLNAQTLHLLAEIYAPGVRFEDPFHIVEGLPALKEYFGRMYASVRGICFDFTATVVDERQAAVCWTMHVELDRHIGPRQMTVPGATTLRFNEHGLITHHRDYFDAGALVYEHIPLLGRAVKAVKAAI